MGLYSTPHLALASVNSNALEHAQLTANRNSGITTSTQSASNVKTNLAQKTANARSFATSLQNFNIDEIEIFEGEAIFF